MVVQVCHRRCRPLSFLKKFLFLVNQVVQCGALDGFMAWHIGLLTFAYYIVPYLTVLLFSDITVFIAGAVPRVVPKDDAYRSWYLYHTLSQRLLIKVTCKWSCQGFNSKLGFMTMQLPQKVPYDKPLISTHDARSLGELNQIRKEPKSENKKLYHALKYLSRA